MEFSAAELKAIRKTITHWERDIMAGLSQGMHIHADSRGELRWGNGKLVKCYANSSALCRMCLVGEGEIECKKCPYLRYHGVGCNDRRSAWFSFVTGPTIETCELMIDSLKSLIHTGAYAPTNGEGIIWQCRIELKSGVVSVCLN